MKYECNECEADTPCRAGVDGESERPTACFYDRPTACFYGGDADWREVKECNPATIEGDRQPTDPDYYDKEIQHWDAVYQQFGSDGCMAHVFSYAWRAGKKPGVPLLTDLRKLRNWVDFLIQKETLKTKGEL